MGYVLMLLIFTVLIMGFVYWLNECKNEKIEAAIAAAIICLLISAVLVIMPLILSYNSAIGMRKRLASMEQYAATINIYADKGVAEFKRNSPSVPIQLTDLKYNQYQQQLGTMLKELRYNIVGYNETLAGKKALKDGWFFNWVVILPQDLKHVKMSDYIK